MISTVDYDIANEAFSLGEKFLDDKLIRKMPISLPKRFAYNVIAIEAIVRTAEHAKQNKRAYKAVLRRFNQPQLMVSVLL